MAPEILEQQLFTTLKFSQQSKLKLYNWAISIRALNPWSWAAKPLWRWKAYREKDLQYASSLVHNKIIYSMNLESKPTDDGSILACEIMNWKHGE